MNGWHSICLQLCGWLSEKVLLKLRSARVGRTQVHEKELCLRKKTFFFCHQNCSNVTAISFVGGSSL